MNPPPKQLGGANVICYAVITSEIKPTGGCRQIVAGVLQGPASALAICQYDGENNFYLFGCDENWQDVTDTWHETLEDAKHQAEFEYTGVSNAWQHVS
jgi:hypothetical protein